MRSRYLFAISAFASLLIAPLAVVHADDQVYRWVDAKGVPHYSDSPPPDDAMSAREITVRNAPPAAAPVSEGEGEATAAAAPAATSASAIAASRLQFCERAKENLKTLQESGDVMQDLDGDGVKDLLNADQRDAERKRAQNAIAFYCTK